MEWELIKKVIDKVDSKIIIPIYIEHQEYFGTHHENIKKVSLNKTLNLN